MLLRKKRIQDVFNAIEEDSNKTNDEITAWICATTGCSWRTAKEYVKIARLMHGAL